MTALVIVFAIGLALAALPWRPVACVMAVIYLFWFLPAGPGSDDPVALLSALVVPALLLGWAMGLLILRTLAERAAR